MARIFTHKKTNILNLTVCDDILLSIIDRVRLYLHDTVSTVCPSFSTFLPQNEHTDCRGEFRAQHLEGASSSREARRRTPGRGFLSRLFPPPWPLLPLCPNPIRIRTAPVETLRGETNPHQACCVYWAEKIPPFAGLAQTECGNRAAVQEGE